MAGSPASYGCLEAMNLDGGASVGLAHQGQILLPPGRNLTNVLVVYDRDNQAPAALKQSWERFQKGDRPKVDRTVFFDWILTADGSRWRWWTQIKIELAIAIIWNKLLQAKIMTATKEKTWTVEEYHRMIEAGILNEGDKIELLDGRIVEMSAQTPPHAATTQRTDRYLQHLLRDLAAIRVQLPITLATSEPEPDIAVVCIEPGDYGDHHPNPSEILLLIEVSYSTLQIDRREKAPIYARANIAEYWILDVVDREAYIYRNPGPQGYQSEVVLQDDAIIRMLAFPDIEISLSELFLPVS